LRLSGHFFKALSAIQEEGEIEFNEKTASIKNGSTSVCSDIPIQSIQGKKDIYLENGFLFTLNTSLTHQQERQLSHKIKKGIAWLEKFTVLRALILTIILIILLAAYRYSVILITPLAVSIFPQEWEQTIGKNAYEALNKTILNETELPSIKISRLKEQATEIAFANGFERAEILFHKSAEIGANALAFPGGPIVVTDDLVLLLQSDDLILSVIAHELAHVQQRHSLQQIINIVGVAVIASVVFGSDDTLIEEASVIGINLFANKKSRGFEKEADLLALEYMDNANLDKAAFNLAIEKLTSSFCANTADAALQDCQKNSKSGWLSSHPSGAERLQYLGSVK
jgi:Zn-dependent protease with chaperone function